jgi:Ohr subfamily peroxiredoxin
MTIALTKVAYTTAATSKGGRDGHVKSADGVIDLDLARPGNFSGEPKANPETLFAAGYSACFQGALGLVAKKHGVDASDSTVTAEVSFGPSEDGGFGLAVELQANIPGVDPATTRELIEAAHQVCPYSKATRGNINVTLTVV